MKNTWGNNIQVTIFGESHGLGVGVVVSGLPAGLKIDNDLLNHQMNKRKAYGKISTSRTESDEVIFKSGIFEGYTTGAPCCIWIENQDCQSKDYEKVKEIARPSHVDYVADQKYLGYQDYRGGGHFSGRLTAPLVAAGSLAMMFLKQKGIQLGSHLLQVHQIKDDSFSTERDVLEKQVEKMNQEYFAVLNEVKREEMKGKISQVKEDNDSVGGIIETVVLNLPIGVGEPFFDSLESRLAHAIFSIGGVKGIEFGLGFQFSNYLGSEANDEMEMKNNQVQHCSNHNGGILGGLSTGMPIHFKTVIKPTASIGKKQKTINMKMNRDEELILEGRHDPCIVHRARVVVDSVTALVLLDLLIDAQGKGSFLGERR